MWLYHHFKAVYGFFTGTTELYRICDAVVRTNKLENIVFPVGAKEEEVTLLESRKLSLDPEVLYRMGTTLN